ncbi:MAG: ComEC/Rec2 family competence protein [Alphaproteobacteria bacterium]|nr:ComEC/Rec2 family competence protein [Alphaproteobacteria bacterium]
MIGKKIIKYFERISQKFLQAEEQRINLCLPVMFALGIIFYFALPFEPKIWLFLCFFILSIIGFLFFRSKNNLALIFLLSLFFFGGVCRIIIQTNLTQSPFIHKRYSFVATQGKVEKVEWRHSGIRLTLTDLKLNKIPQEDYPVRIRVSVNGQDVIPTIGDTVSLKTTLSPPMLASYPNGYNYARSAYYDKIGAVGYSVSKLQIISKSKESFLQNIRTSIFNRIKNVLSKDTGDIAAALVTGEQGGISQTTRNNYTSAGIVHILSVSGFHMSLIAGFIFAILRFLFSLFPSISLRFNTKKVCALLALILTFIYLLISGMGIPAIRSFLMIAFILIAIMADRQALSMRSVVWAGFLILLIQPQAVIGIGFALSFGAVMALISGYETFTPYFKKLFTHKNWIKWIIGTICFFLLMNIIAHFATAPIAVHYFHRYNNYGILGNFLISLIFSFLVMPLLFIATLMMPFGLDKPFLLCVDYLLKIVNKLTEGIANLPASTVFLPSFPTWGYALILSGSVWLLIFKSRIRYVGFVPVFIGLLSIFTYTTPDAIIGQGGKLIAVRQGDTFAFNTLKQQKSTRHSWLENNGINPDILPPKMKDTSAVEIQGLKVDLTGKNNADIVINSHGKCNATLLCIPRKKLWQEGVHTLYINDGKIKIKTSADGTFNRPWGQGQFQK